MKIAIIGAGLTGLTAGYRLSQKNHKVTIFEKERKAGGLAAGFQENGWDWPLECFYHHLFTSDMEIKKLISDLDLNRQLFYLKPKTSIYYQNQIVQFDTPISLLRFPFLNPIEKIQVGLATLFLKFFPFWRLLEKETSSRFLPKIYGQKAYKILWEPLLQAKFGEFKNQISLAWFWARIYKRSVSLGYFEGGFQTLTETLKKEMAKRQGQIILNKEISSLEQLKKQYDKIIITAPSVTFSKIAPDLPTDYRETLQQKKMLGSLALILTLKESFLKDQTYWLNINEEGFPFVAVVEHTNFIDKKHYGGHHLLYVGGYYPQYHPYFKMTKEALVKEFLPYLQKINPSFNPSLFALHPSLFTDLNAQPIIPINYSQNILPIQTPDPQILLANMEQVYPWDRGTNYAVSMGEAVAHEIDKS